MQYTLAGHFKTQPDDSMPSKTLLYFYSCFKKDEQEARQREELLRNSKKGSRRIPINTNPPDATKKAFRRKP